MHIHTKPTTHALLLVVQNNDRACLFGWAAHVRPIILNRVQEKPLFLQF